MAVFLCHELVVANFLALSAHVAGALPLPPLDLSLGALGPLNVTVGPLGAATVGDAAEVLVPGVWVAVLLVGLVGVDGLGAPLLAFIRAADVLPALALGLLAVLVASLAH